MAKSVSTPARHSQIKPTDLVGFHRALAKRYKTHGRHDLPWRNTGDPYHIWLSEVMLQQTQVATVRDRFYHPFLAKFPTVEALATAPSEAVMKAWEGLGYYSRARNLHEAAKKLVSSEWWVVSREGRLSTPPLTTHHSLLTNLLSLPGIGKNTAHAIAAFAYHQPVAILEANVKRVVARIFALEKPDDKTLWAGAETLLNHQQPFDYNQAMMDLGSMVCAPKTPHCDVCPANSICAGKTNPESYPAAKIKKQVPTKEVTIQVREDAAGRLFLEKREEKLLGGLYGFPHVPYTPSLRRKPRSKATKESVRLLPETPAFAGVTTVGTITHIYSHFKLIGHVMYEKISGEPNSPDWHARQEIQALPLSKLDHKVLALVEACNSGQKKRLKAPRRARPR